MSTPSDRYTQELQNLFRNVRYYREKLGLSQQELARAVEAPVRCIEELERGRLPRQMNMKYLFFMSELFHIPLADLFRDAPRDDRT